MTVVGKSVVMNRKRALLTAAVLWALAPLAAAQGGYKVVANPSVPESSLSRSELSRHFLKKTNRWSDGTKVVPVDQERTSPTRESFSSDVHRKSPDVVAAYWQKQIFSGRGVPPVVKKSDAEVLEHVRSNPGAVGYVSAGASTQGVKVLELE